MALLKQWDGTSWVEVAAETPHVLVHDVPQDNSTTAAISSNWAFDLAANFSAAIEEVQSLIEDSAYVNSLYLGAL